MGLKRLTNPVFPKQLENCKSVGGEGKVISGLWKSTKYKPQLTYIQGKKKKTTELWEKQWESIAFLPGLAT